MKKILLTLLLCALSHFFYAQLSTVQSKGEVEGKIAKEKEIKKKKKRKPRRRFSYEEEYDNTFNQEEVSLIATKGKRRYRKSKRFKKKDVKIYYGVETGIGFLFGNNFNAFDSLMEQEDASLKMFTSKVFPFKIFIEIIPQKSKTVLRSSFYFAYSVNFRSSQSFIPSSAITNSLYGLNAFYNTSRGVSHVLSFGYDYSYKTLFLSGIDITKLYFGLSLDAMLSSFKQQVSYRSSPLISSQSTPYTYTSLVSRKVNALFNLGIGLRTGVQFRATPKIIVDGGVKFTFYIGGNANFTVNSLPNVKGFEDLPVLQAKSIKINPTSILQPYIGLKYSF